jgi:hypothetical protein
MIPDAVTRTAEPAHVEWPAVVGMGGLDGDTRDSALLTGIWTHQDAVSDGLPHVAPRFIAHPHTFGIGSYPSLSPQSHARAKLRISRISLLLAFSRPLLVRQVVPMLAFIAASPILVVERISAAVGSVRGRIAAAVGALWAGGQRGVMALHEAVPDRRGRSAAARAFGDDLATCCVLFIIATLPLFEELLAVRLVIPSLPFLDDRAATGRLVMHRGASFSAVLGAACLQHVRAFFIVPEFRVGTRRKGQTHG